MSDDLKALDKEMENPSIDSRAVATPRFELPPELINGIIEKLLAALIERILAYFQPSPTPPAVINPPPIIVAPPPGIDPGPPGGPPTLVYEQWIRAGIHVVYHNWFKGDSAQGVPEGESTPHETEMIRQGLMGFPPAANVRISADPMPTNCIEFPFPKIHVIRKNEETGLEEEVVLTKENPQPESWVIIQGGQTAGGDYIRSNGHFPILVFDAPSVRSSIRIWFEASNGARSNDFGMPWAIRGDGRSPALMTTSASRKAEPFPDDEPQELQYRIR